MSLIAERAGELRARIDDLTDAVLSEAASVDAGDLSPDLLTKIQAATAAVTQAKSYFGLAEADETVSSLIADEATGLLSDLLAEIQALAPPPAPEPLTVAPTLNLNAIGSRLTAMASALNPPSTLDRISTVRAGLTAQGYIDGAAIVETFHEGTTRGVGPWADPTDLAGAERAVGSLSASLERDGASGLVRDEVGIALSVASPAYIASTLRSTLEQLLNAAAPPTEVLADVDLLQRGLAVLTGDVYNDTAFRIGARAVVDGAVQVLVAVAKQHDAPMPAALGAMPEDLTGGIVQIEDEAPPQPQNDLNPRSMTEAPVPLNARWELVFLPDEEVLYEAEPGEKETLEARLAKALKRAQRRFDPGTPRTLVENYLIRPVGLPVPAQIDPPVVAPVVAVPHGSSVSDVKLAEPTETAPDEEGMNKIVEIVASRLTEAGDPTDEPSLLLAVMDYVFDLVANGVWDDPALDLAETAVRAFAGTQRADAEDSLKFWTNAPAALDLPTVPSLLETTTIMADDGTAETWRLLSIPESQVGSQQSLWQTGKNYAVLTEAIFKNTILHPSTVGVSKPQTPHPPGAPAAVGLVRVEMAGIWMDAIAAAVVPATGPERVRMDDDDVADANLPGGVEPFYRIAGVPPEYAAVFLPFQEEGKIRILGEVIKPLTPETIRAEWNSLLPQWVGYIADALVGAGGIKVQNFPPRVERGSVITRFKYPDPRFGMDWTEIEIRPHSPLVTLKVTSTLGLYPDTVTNTWEMDLKEALDPSSSIPWVMKQFRERKPKDWGIAPPKDEVTDLALSVWLKDIRGEALRILADTKDRAFSGDLFGEEA